MVDYTEGSGKQYHINLSENEVGKYVILTGDPKRCQSIVSHFENPKLMADNREYTTYTGTLNGTKVSVTSTGIGGPSAAIALEELVRLGAHTFIRVGTSGGMQDEVIGGDLVIANAAIRLEGTSKEYAPIEYPAVANIDVINALSNAAKERGLRYHVGVIQSKDSFYGEHEPEVMPVSYELEHKWEAWIKMGCLASEMECAALFTVGAFRRVRVGAILLALANQERERKGLSNPQYHDTSNMIKVAVDAMSQIIDRDKNEI